MTPEINWSHPLARGLEICVEFLEVGGYKPLELVRRIQGVKSDNPVVGPRGLEFRTGSSSYTEFSNIPDAKLLLGLTLQWRGVVTSGNLRHFAGKHTGGGGTNNPFDFRLDGGTNLVCVRADASTPQSDTGAAITVLKPQSYTYVDPRPNTSRTREFWINGIRKTVLGAASNLPVTGSSTTLRIGRRADGVAQMNGVCQYFRAWSRGLTGPEIKWLEEEPYTLFNFPVKRSYFIGAANPALTQAAADDLAQPWTDALATGYGVTGMAFTDSLTLTEAQGIRYGLNLAGESANNWTDNLAFNYLAPSTPLSVTIEDKIIRSGSINGNNFALRDALGFAVGPSGPVYVAVSDLGTYLDDSNLALGYGLAVAD